MQAMSWDDLRYLLAVERCGSLASAARVLCVDQTTVGRRLEALQRSLGARLLERTAAGYRLTALGRRACAVGGDVERAMAALEREGESATARLEGVVRIAAPEGMVPLILRALRELRAAHPKLIFEVRVGSAVVNLAKTWLTGALPEIWLFFLGALFVAVTLAFPSGIVGLARQKFVRRKPDAPVAVPAE